jgi:macrolide-specific efflux system membrane fusion protein
VVPDGALQQGVMAYPAQVTLDAGAPLPIGATVRVTIRVAQRDDVLVVPQRALHRSGDGTTVTVVTPTGVSLRAVTVGLSDGQVAEITSGLEAGDVVLLPDARGAAS